jgi:rubrerythrin
VKIVKHPVPFQFASVLSVATVLSPLKPEEEVIPLNNEEKIDQLKEMVNQLIKVEEEVVNLTEDTINQAQNSTVKYLLRSIQHDSRKHADWGRAALEILEFKKIVGTEERKQVWDLLEKHEALERKHRGFVAEMKSISKTPALQYIFDQILSDEKKHHQILETLMTKRFEKDPAAQWGILLGY